MAIGTEFVEDLDFVRAGDPITGDSPDGSVHGVANRVARQLLSNLNQIRLSSQSSVDRDFKHINGVTITAQPGGYGASAGDYVIVDYRETDAGSVPAITRINLPTGASDGDSVRLRRIAYGSSETLPVIHVYHGTGNTHPIINSNTGARSWPTAPTTLDQGATGAGRSIARQANRSVDNDATGRQVTRIDDITFTWYAAASGTNKWRVQPSALVERSAEPLLALLEDAVKDLNEGIDALETDSTRAASTSQSGQVTLAGTSASNSRNASDSSKSVTPAGVDAVMDDHEANFDASESAEGHVRFATTGEMNSNSPTDAKAVSPSKRASTSNYGVTRLADDADNRAGTENEEAVTPRGLRRLAYGIGTLADAANVAWDVQAHPLAQVTLTSSRTLAVPTNRQNGGHYRLIVKQDGTGGHNLTLHSSIDKGSLDQPEIDTGGDKYTILDFMQFGGTLRYLGLVAGYS